MGKLSLTEYTVAAKHSTVKGNQLTSLDKSEAAAILPACPESMAEKPSSN